MLAERLVESCKSARVITLRRAKESATAHPNRSLPGVIDSPRAVCQRIEELPGVIEVTGGLKRFDRGRQELQVAGHVPELGRARSCRRLQVFDGARRVFKRELEVTQDHPVRDRPEFLSDLRADSRAQLSRGSSFFDIAQICVDECGCVLACWPVRHPK